MATAVAPTRQEIAAVIDKYKQWELAGGKFKGPQPVLPLARFSEGSVRLHNLKNLEVRKFLQWEKWSTPTINLGYTDNAEPATARKVARWFFARKGGSEGPINYGETIAIGYGTAPSFYCYKDRLAGVNIGNVGTPAFEWKLLGGVAGQPVRTGERLAIYNETDSNILIYFRRELGVHLGWPDSKTLWDRTKDWTEEAVKKAVVEYVKAYVGG